MNSKAKANFKALVELSQIFDKVKICQTCKDSCCVFCGLNSGYLKNDNVDPDYLESLKQQYNFGPKGFLTETGCALPREKRSSFCLAYTCHKLASHVKPADVHKLKEIRELFAKLQT